MIGDELAITEDAYLNKIGALIMISELYIKRINVKDGHIKKLEEEIASLKQELASKGKKNG